MTPPPGPGRIVGLFTAASAGEPMIAHQRVEIVAGKGIPGDRYAEGRGLWSATHYPVWNLTIIEQETLDALHRDHGIDLRPELTRRNVVSAGVSLNRLVGRTLRVGSAVVRVARLNRPCRYLAKLVELQVYEPLLNRSGIDCEVLVSGTAALGDDVRQVVPG